MAWDLTELRREIVLDFADAQSLLEDRASSVWWHVHACFVRDKQAAKKRWSLRALRKRLFRRPPIECKNPKCRVRFVPYRGDTLYCTVQCRVRSLALAAYHARCRSDGRKVQRKRERDYYRANRDRIIAQRRARYAAR